MRHNDTTGAPAAGAQIDFAGMGVVNAVFEDAAAPKAPKRTKKERDAELLAAEGIRTGRHALVALDSHDGGSHAVGRVYSTHPNRHAAGTALLKLRDRDVEGIWQYVDALPLGIPLGAVVIVDCCRGPLTDAAQNDRLLLIEKRAGRRIGPA